MWSKIFGILKVLFTGVVAGIAANQGGASLQASAITGCVTAVTAVAPLLHPTASK